MQHMSVFTNRLLLVHESFADSQDYYLLTRAFVRNCLNLDTRNTLLYLLYTYIKGENCYDLGLIIRNSAFLHSLKVFAQRSTSTLFANDVIDIEM